MLEAYYYEKYEKIEKYSIASTVDEIVKKIKEDVSGVKIEVFHFKDRIGDQMALAYSEIYDKESSVPWYQSFTVLINKRG